MAFRTDRIFVPFQGHRHRIMRHESLGGVREVWSGLSFLQFEEEDGAEILGMSPVEDPLLRSLSSRGVPVRARDEQFLHDPPKNSELEKRIPHFYVELLGDVMGIGDGRFAFRYRVEAYEFRKLEGRHRVSRIVLWSADVLGQASSDGLERTIWESIDEVMEPFAADFLRFNPGLDSLDVRER